MYTLTIHGIKHRFVTFEEVIKWAWDMYKISYDCDPDAMSEGAKHIECRILSYMINHPEDPDCEWMSEPKQEEH